MSTLFPWARKFKTFLSCMCTDSFHKLSVRKYFDKFCYIFWPSFFEKISLTYFTDMVS